MTILPNIAFIGRAGAGKTTARQYLEEAYGYEPISFAAPLKAGCGTADDRGLLQRVGQGVRDLHEDFWVNLLLEEKRACANEGQRFFTVDDCRHPNEAAALKGEGFIIVRVDTALSVRRDRLKRNGRLQDEQQLYHVSETSLDSFREDYVVYNNNAWPEDLHVQLDDIVNRERS